MFAVILSFKASCTGVTYGGRSWALNGLCVNELEGGREGEEVGGREGVGGRRRSKCLLKLTRNIAHIQRMNLEEGGYWRTSCVGSALSASGCTRLISGPSR